MENEQVIRQKMQRTRDALTDKLETLETKLLGSVQQAASAVTETVVNVKETMHDGVESVKDAVDIPAHVDRHPWLAFGSAVAGGFLLASYLGRSREVRRTPTAFPPAPPAPTNGRHEAARQSPGGSTGLLAVLDPEIQHLKSLALGAALGTVREMLTEEVPPHMAEQLRNIIDGVTRKLGADPLPSSDWDALKSAQASSTIAQQGDDSDTNEPRW